MKKSITLDVFNEYGASLGKKRFYTTLDNKESINKWIKQYDDKKNFKAGLLDTRGNDFQNQQYINIKSQDFIITAHSTGFYLTHYNLIPMAVYFSVRHCIKATWINDRDQFLSPNKKWEKDIEFHSDCLVFMLFHGQNRITAKDGTNHFIPFSEKDIDAAEAFESHFMQDFLQGKIKPDSTCHTNSAPCHTERSEVSKKLDSRFFANAQNEVSLENDNLSHRHTDSAPCHTERSEVSKKLDSRFFANAQNDNTHTCKNYKTKSKLLQQSLFHDELESTFIPTKPLIFSDEAKEVLQAGKEIFKHYHTQAKDSKDYNPNAALYDIKAHFQGFNDKGKMNPPQKAQDEAYKQKLGTLNYALKNLAKKIEIKVYEYGFLLP